MTVLDELERGSAYPLSAWPNNGVPRVAAGVYTIWDGTQLIYVGMSGRGLAKTDIESPDEPAKAKGLWTRLNSHASGRRSGDQFCVYVCDRLIVPSLSPDQQRAIGEGRLLLDAMTRDYVRTRLSYRYVVMPDGVSAYTLEEQIRRGALSVGRPLLNPS